MRNFFIALTRTPLGLLGVAITTASAVLMLTLFAIELVGLRGNPYVGIIAYVILPAFFLAGLLLIPVGIAQGRRKARQARQRGELPPAFPVIDLNLDQTRRRALVFLLLTMVNVVILATATYKGVEVMDSTEFCGQACHKVMAPEYTAYEGSPHARVKCVECHIGPGADWYVKAKLSGAWQLVSTTLDLYPRPIPTPIHNLRPSRDTCEQCHWPTKFVGDRLKVITRHAEDEASTPLKTVLLLRVGGVQGVKSHGIHWHVDPKNQIRYRSDESREKIYDVELDREGDPVRTYRAPGAAAADSGGDWRIMDCIDCHNRPTHIYRLPVPAVDAALNEGKLPASLPYIRREATRALQSEYASQAAARAGINAAIGAFYAGAYPDLARERQAEVEAVGKLLGEIYSRNVFPSMKVTWGTYADHIGHENYPGCFRCHDDEHAADDGHVISQDCSTCHELLAIEEENPEILTLLQQ